MSFIRPEASQTIATWAEPVIYAGLAILCGVKGIGLLANGHGVGVVLAAIGLFAIFAFYGAVTRSVYAQRMRDKGPGIVSVLEGRISYLGPLGGAIMARDALVSVEAMAPEISSRHLVLLQPWRRAELSPRYGGQIAELLVDDQDEVIEGDMLVRLVDADATGSLMSAKASQSSSKERLMPVATR